jgi:hypothetical protein
MLLILCSKETMVNRHLERLFTRRGRVFAAYMALRMPKARVC